MRYVLFGAVLIAAIASCQDEAGRFPVCRNNKECISQDKDKPVCENLRCVECAYDTDCRDSGKGESCNRQSNECIKIQ